MDITGIEKTQDNEDNKAYRITLETEPEPDNLIVIVAYHDKATGEVTIRADNYDLKPGDQAYQTIMEMESFRNRLEIEPPETCVIMPNDRPPYNLHERPGRRNRGYFA